MEQHVLDLLGSCVRDFSPSGFKLLSGPLFRLLSRQHGMCFITERLEYFRRLLSARVFACLYELLLLLIVSYDDYKNRCIDLCICYPVISSFC